ncbi:MAG: phenylalanine--tRNA ligase subunit beta, partial [Solirubrobacterales bacterium]|nr:phenylalanine--tRNA ligase subunit beta [Solirubrobacterales bacterium]
MKIPWSWLIEYCDPGLEPGALAERLAMTGTEVERVVTVGPPSPERFVIGKVVSVDPHPDADRLSVCVVDDGEGERTIVCGAPNVAPGQTVVVALPGAVMPDGTKLRKAKLRGVASEGMICSETELGLGTESDGILALDEGPGAGTAAREVLPLSEPVLELEVTPNRTDCLSLYGVARETHAVTGADLAAAPWDVAEPPTPGTGDDRIAISVADPEKCPRFTARVYTGVRVGPSPLWLRARLTAAGQRPINNVVDITNYVMWLTGQPMHAYDLDRIPGGELEIRGSRAGETVETLDGVERDLPEGTTVVCDRDGPAGIAGVMGASVSEVSAGTTTVLLEAATWSGPDILRTSRELNLRSEASSRFEKQLHPELAMRAQTVSAGLMERLCGASGGQGLVDLYAPLDQKGPIRLRAGRVDRVLGLEIDQAEQQRTLEALGFAVEPDGGDLLVSVPPDRWFDVTREIDLVEEVGRIDDLDRRLPATLPRGSGTVGGLSRQQALQRRAEDSLRESGFSEIVGWSFTDPGEAGRLRLGGSDPRARPVVLSNPLSEDQSVMRTTLLGSVLDAARRNLARGTADVALFESGRVYLPGGEAGPGPLGGDFPGKWSPPVNEPQHLCLVWTGAVEPGSWNRMAEPVDFFSVKGVLERLASGLCTEVEVRAPEDPESEPFLHPARYGEVLVGGRTIGWIGQLHPAVAAEWDLADAFGFELDLAEMLAAS